MDHELQASYLRRLGLDAEPPSIDALQRLHRRQVECVPYETLWIHMGEPWTVDTAAAVNRIARQDRGGYCFHLNGAFSELLASLGYDVRRHLGGVHGPDGFDDTALSNHLVLSVRGLPSDENPGGTWYVDAGLGDALHEPLPLVAGNYVQAPFHFVIEATPGDLADWHLTHDPAGGFAGMGWQAGDATMEQFEERHAWLSTSPDSGFVRVVTAQRRDATGVDIMRGLVLARVGDGALAERALTERDDWFGALGDIFGLRLDGVAPDRRDHLWNRTLATHRAWEERQSID